MAEFNPYTSNIKLTSVPTINTDNINYNGPLDTSIPFLAGANTNLATGVPNPAQSQTPSTSSGAANPPNPTKRTISSIKKSLLHPSLTSHFECYFPPPPSECDSFIKQVVKFSSIQDLLLISCSDASLPGSQLTTHDLNNDIMGVTQRHAYRRQYDDRADFTFYVTLDPSHGYSQIRYFERWIQYIAGEQIATSSDIFYPYRVKYPDKYKTTIFITKFERDTQAQNVSGGQKLVYRFFRAFPISISSMPVSYESSQLLKVTVSFTYDRYAMGDVSSATASPQQSSQPTATGVPNNFNLSPEFQALANSSFGSNLNLAGIDTRKLLGNGEVYQFNTNQTTPITVNPYTTNFNLNLF